MVRAAQSASVTSGWWTTNAPYVLVALQRGRLVPYALVELQTFGGGVDPFFSPDASAPDARQSFVGVNVGVRVEVSNWSAVKLEYRAQKPFGAALGNELVLNWSFGI